MSAEPLRAISGNASADKGAARHLRNALIALATGHATIAHHAQKAWASITFSGSRHTLRLIFEGDAAVACGEEFIAALPDHEFSIPEQLVAEASVSSVEHSLLPEPRMLVECELLLLIDA